jgi:hypothetical protein
MNLSGWFCITSDVLKVVGVVVVSSSHPYCWIGFMYAFYAAFSIDLELPHLLCASLSRTLSFFLLFQLFSLHGFSMSVFHSDIHS